MTEQTYTERLGVPRPVLEKLVGRPELKLVDLLVACLFERGGPMAPEEVAERLGGLGVTSRTGDLPLSLQRAASSVSSVYRDEEGRFCFALDCPEHELHWRLLQLRVGERAPASRPRRQTQEPTPLPPDTQPLTAEEAADGVAWAGTLSGLRQVAAVLDVAGGGPLSLEVIRECLEAWKPRGYRVNWEMPWTWVRPPVRQLDDGRLALDREAPALRATRRTIREGGAKERAYRERETRSEEIQARYAEERRDRLARSRQEAAARRRVVLHAVPSKGEVGAAVLLDPETREIETFVGEELARLPECLAGHDLVVGIQPEKALDRLGIEPGGDWILVDLDRPQKTKSLPGRGRRLLRITNEMLMAGTLEARRPLGDDATYRRQLAEGPPSRVRRRLEADAKNLWAYYRFGVLNSAVTLRWGGFDETIPAYWSRPGYPSIEQLGREVMATGGLLDLVVGAPPSWDDPWGTTVVAQPAPRGEWDWSLGVVRGDPNVGNGLIFEARPAEPERPPAVARRASQGAAEPGADRIAELQVTLAESDPPIRRRVRMPCSFTLADLHWVIQAVFDWENCHLHEFRVRGERYEAPSPFDRTGTRSRALDGSEVSLWGLKLGVAGRRFEYLYDFGDDWLHEIEVVRAGPAEPGVEYPVCVSGERATPPEDCGGIWGYQRLLEILADPEDPEHEDMKAWLGRDLDPERFDLDRANERLRDVYPPEA